MHKSKNQHIGKATSLHLFHTTAIWAQIIPYNWQPEHLWGSHYNYSSKSVCCLWQLSQMFSGYTAKKKKKTNRVVTLIAGDSDNDILEVNCISNLRYNWQPSEQLWAGHYKNYTRNLWWLSPTGYNFCKKMVVKIGGWIEMSSRLQCEFIQVQTVATSFCQGLGLHPLSSEGFQQTMN